MSEQLEKSIIEASRQVMRADFHYHQQLDLIEKMRRKGHDPELAIELAGSFLRQREQAHAWLRRLIELN